MSRTIRRLPQYSRSQHSVKRFKPHISSYIKPTGRTLHFYEKGIGLLGNHIGVPMDYIERDPVSKCFRIKESFYHKDTEDIVQMKLEQNILYWCKKNKTCRRQRKNAVRKTKKCANGKDRAKNKQHTLQALREFYEGDY